MPARTYLTAPAGTEPSEATGPGADEPRERYVPGLAPATEPHVPGRWRTPAIVLAVIAVIVIVVVTVLRVSAAQQAQDPSLLVPGQSEDDGPTPSLRDAIPDADAGDGGGLPGDG